MAKCPDMFSAEYRDGNGGFVDYDGSVPAWFPNLNEKHYGDYVQLNIDLDTGKILNWKVPTEEQLQKTFNLLDI